MRVAVVGAGIGGLAVAGGLRRCGAEVTGVRGPADASNTGRRPLALRQRPVRPGRAWLSRMGSQVVTSARVVPRSELHAVLASRLEQRAGLGTKPPVMARRIQRTMSRTFRPGTWRQAVLTFCAVLPMSLLLNFVVTPILAGWPKLALTVLNATLLVATLNWALLPALNYVTAGWAAPRASGSLTRPPLGGVARRMVAHHRRRQSPSSTIDGDDRIAG